MLDIEELKTIAGLPIRDNDDVLPINWNSSVPMNSFYNLSIEHDMTSLSFLNFQIDTVLKNLSREMLLYDTLKSLTKNRSIEAANTYFEVLDKLGMSMEDEQIEEKKQNIFQKIWEAIKAAFRKIGELFAKIGRWFKNLFSGKKKQEDKEIQEKIPEAVEAVKSEDTKKINEKFFKLTETMKTGKDGIIVEKARKDLLHQSAAAFYKKSLGTFNTEVPKILNSVSRMFENSNGKTVGDAEKMNTRITGSLAKTFNETFGVEMNESSIQAPDKVVNRVFYGTDAPQKQKLFVRDIILKIPQSVLDNSIHIYSGEIDGCLSQLKKAVDDLNRQMDKYGQQAKKAGRDKNSVKSILATFNSAKAGYSFLLQFAHKFKKESETIRNVYKKAYKLYKKYTVSDGDKSDIEYSDKEKQDHEEAMKLKEHVESGKKVEL